MKHELDNYEWGVIPIRSYKGVLLEKISGGYKVLNQKASTPKEVDDIISKAGKAISNSIVVSNKGNFGVTNTK